MGGLRRRCSYSIDGAITINAEGVNSPEHGEARPRAAREQPLQSFCGVYYAAGVNAGNANEFRWGA